MKRIGIWMDKEKAHIVRLKEETTELETIYSDLDFYKPVGGSRTRSAKWGPQDVVHDSKYLEKEKQQLKKYFNKVADAIGDVDVLALFGPADTSQKFKQALDHSHNALAKKIKAVTKADSMTENQLKALVRVFFSQ